MPGLMRGTARASVVAPNASVVSGLASDASNAGGRRGTSWRNPDLRPGPGAAGGLGRPRGQAEKTKILSVATLTRQIRTSGPFRPQSFDDPLPGGLSHHPDRG